MLYPRERVIVEVDGYEYHSDRESFERDREREAVMLAADYVTFRITKERVKRQPERGARRLHTILTARRQAAT